MFDSVLAVCIVVAQGLVVWLLHRATRAFGAYTEAIRAHTSAVLVVEKRQKEVYAQVLKALDHLSQENVA